MTTRADQVKNEGTQPAQLKWSMQDADADAKESSKAVDLSIEASLVLSCLLRRWLLTYGAFIDTTLVHNMPQEHWNKSCKRQAAGGGAQMSFTGRAGMHDDTR